MFTIINVDVKTLYTGSVLVRSEVTELAVAVAAE